ncbi:uncharacterized protein LOC127847634 isoform X1 [Dreissena polymorpha]|uniref:Uncharacterized protein n=1 Tax=Dreissena polymorpha TaxID=45954 RepID=A0A9D4DGY0_DREPO|nr:uncharacterized protein LOC127847634 isoform X1 [Dreissena polymorpha]XP_052235634.1 uncharacterized protein LOC127847634 isoform X1 [Dreissena polymorpha]KAH3749447.1 hypothetical protein DPMN_183945 [Dreissena polymorpha]
MMHCSCYGQPVTARGDGTRVMLPSSSYADTKLEQNQMAGYLTLLGNMVNQQTFVQTNGAALIGELLQKIMIVKRLLAVTIKCICLRLPLSAHNKSSGLGHGL